MSEFASARPSALLNQITDRSNVAELLDFTANVSHEPAHADLRNLAISAARSIGALPGIGGILDESLDMGTPCLLNSSPDIQPEVLKTYTFQIPNGPDLFITLPTQEQILNAPYEAMMSLWQKNHEALLQFVDHFKESIPFFGLHGRSQERMDELFESRNGTDRYGNKDALYFSTFSKRSLDSERFLEDLYAVARQPLAYANPTELNRLGAPYTPGGVMIADLSKKAYPSQLNPEEGPEIPGLKFIKKDSPRELGEAPPTHYSGEVTHHITPDNFDAVVKGIVPRALLAAFELPETESMQRKDYWRIGAASMFCKQAVVSEVLSILGVGKDGTPPPSYGEREPANFRINVPPAPRHFLRDVVEQLSECGI